MKTNIDMQYNDYFNCDSDEEGVAQTPNISFNKLRKRSDDEISIDHDDEKRVSVLIPSSKINSSITFKKPTNKIEYSKRGNSFEAETSCDSSANESDDESPCMTPEEAMFSEQQYLALMRRTYFVVKETKQAKFKGLSSPVLLRSKLYDLLSMKSTPCDTDMLFEEGDLNRHTTIKRNSEPMVYTPKTFSSSLKATKPRRRTSAKLSLQNDSVSSFFDFLTSVNC